MPVPYRPWALKYFTACSTTSLPARKLRLYVSSGNLFAPFAPCYTEYMDGQARPWCPGIPWRTLLKVHALRSSYSCISYHFQTNVFPTTLAVSEHKIPKPRLGLFLQPPCEILPIIILWNPEKTLKLSYMDCLSNLRSCLRLFLPWIFCSRLRHLDR